MEGSNYTADKIFRIRVPLYTDDSITPNGVRFYFPDTPAIDKEYIKGIEAHLAPNVITGDPGDLVDRRLYSGVNSKTLLADLAKYVYVTISGFDLEEKNYYVPLTSLFNLQTTGIVTTKRVKSYFGKIKTRNSYLIIPANSPVTIVGNSDVNITFYY